MQDHKGTESTPTSTRAGSGAGRRQSDHTNVTPHTLEPENYHKALSSEPGLYTIGFAHMNAVPSEAGAASPSGPDSPQSDAVAQRDEAVGFLTGNPSVQQWKGQVRICRVNPDGSLARDRSLQVCVLAVPTFMTIADLCRFIGQHMDKVRHLRLVHEEARARYVALLEMDSQESADALYIEFNGKPYSSMDTERCVVLFVKDILFLDESSAGCIGWNGGSNSTVAKGKSPRGAPISFAGDGHTELPSCPVCLERLDTSVTGIMTTICNHSFHCRCLSDWPDSSCPVCRYTQMPEAEQTGGCMHCGEPEDLWMCLVCGFMGCGRYRSQHALQHFRDSGHSFSIELLTQRVWDYTGDNYVHRLVANKVDGKLVELPEGQKSKSEEDAKLQDALVGSKLDSVLHEYNDMLTRTLDDQRRFFEDRMTSMQQQWEAESKSLKEEVARKDRLLQDVERKLRERKSEDKKVLVLSERLKKAWEEAEFHKQCNASLTENQEALHAKLQAAAIKDEQIQELREQVRDLMFFLEAQKSVEASEHAEEIQSGQVVVQASPLASRRRKDKSRSPGAPAAATGGASGGASEAGR